VSASRLNKTVRELVRELAHDGWESRGVQHGGHVLLVHAPSGARLVVSTTPSDRRIAHQVRQSARRAIREAREG
jgi:predicted RNA binding protein YcfA (HicA-like mRNA interferase family)